MPSPEASYRHEKPHYMMCLSFRNYAHDCHYLDLHPIVDLTDEQFYQLCQANPDIKIERDAEGK